MMENNEMVVNNNINYKMKEMENQMSNGQMYKMNSKNNETGSNADVNCMNTYTPMHEAVGNVCDPTATFQNELNAQGLNNPEGFNSPTVGSPLN